MKYLALSTLLTVAAADEILASYIFQRHGDRLQKPSIYVTPIGEQQEHDAGSFFNNRYFNESPIAGLSSIYTGNQIDVQIPTNDVLFKSIEAFLQGFYPPVSGSEISKVQGASMANGTNEDTPLNGYQYVTINGVDGASSNYWTVKGDDSCPAYTTASNGYLNTDDFKQTNASTFDFYQGLYQYVEGALPKSKLNFANAYTVYDHFTMEVVHNQTFADMINGTDVYFQVTTRADQFSRGVNTNPPNVTNSAMVVAGISVLNNVYEFLSTAQNTSSPERLAILGGSYDAFYQVFDVLGFFAQDEAKFTGQVGFATSLAFELVHRDSDGSNYVQIGLRNGTAVDNPDVEMTYWPAFGINDGSNQTHLDTFLSTLKPLLTVTDDRSWCSVCQATSTVCQLYKLQDRMSLPAAGGIGAGVTIGVFLLAGIAGLLLVRLLSRKKQAPTIVPSQASIDAKESHRSDASDATHV